MAKKQEKGLTGDLSQHEIVTIAVYLLGGDRRSIDTEDVAVKAHALAPGRFAWRKYPDQINLELIRVFLSDAKKPDKGALMSGSGRTGWQLTLAGLEWAQKTADALNDRDLSRTRSNRKAGSVDEQRWRRERERLLSTIAWGRWISGDREISTREAADVFRIDSYAVGALRETKIMRLRALFDEDSEIVPFLVRITDIVRDA